LTRRSLENIQLERGQTNTALQAPAPVSSQTRDVILKRRTDADSGLVQALERITEGSVPDGRRLIGELRQAYDRAKGLRREADSAMLLPKDQRNPQLLTAWYPALNDLVVKTQDLWTASSREVSKDDPIVGQLRSIKQSAFLMREYGGRERAALAGNISAKRALSAEQQQDIATWRGHLQSNWQIVRDLSTGGEAALTKAVAEAQRLYFAEFQRQTATVYKAGMAGGDYSMSIAQWYEYSDVALDSLVGIKDAAVEVTSAHATARSMAAAVEFVLAVLLTLLGIGASVASFWVVSRRVVGPLTLMTTAMQRLAGGDKAIDVPASDRGDEVGAMARSVEVFRNNAIKADALAAEREAEEEKKEKRRQFLDELTRGFDRTASGVLREVARSVEEMRATATKMSTIAAENTGKATAVAAAAEETAANVNTVAAATEQLSASVTEISRQVTTSAGIAANAVQEAEGTNEEIQRLAVMSQRIGDIVKLINDIAAQTNLLALNATIEAARAGEAGKGFAVVAAEVKSLANQTSKATEEIGAQVAGIQNATKKSVVAIGAIGRTIGDINEITTTIASAVNEQGAATQEIARSVQQAAAGTQDVSSNVSGVTEGAAATRSAAVEVEAAAGDLSDQAQRLREQVDAFLTQVRAA
jgi:methyl-accepting chemotaxis protein